MSAFALLIRFFLAYAIKRVSFKPYTKNTNFILLFFI